MALAAPGRARERILLIGPWGAGKSTAWSKIHEYNKLTGSESKLWVCDSDRAVDRVCPDLPLEQVADVYEMPDFTRAAKEFRKIGGVDDWLIVDLIDKAWEAAQDYYIEEAFGMGAADYFLGWKKENAAKKGSALSDAFGSNWQVINKLYKEFINEVLRFPGHILACAPAEPVALPDRKGEGGDDKETLDAFGMYGVKPSGQKKLGFQFLSVLLLNPRGKEQWAFTGMKDVKRERPQNKPMVDFVQSYLIEVAGWTM